MEKKKSILFAGGASVLMVALVVMVFLFVQAKQAAGIYQAQGEEMTAQIEALTANVADKDSQIESLTANVAGQIEALTADVTDKNGQIEALTADVADKNGQIEALTADVADKNGQIEALTADVADKNSQIEALTANVADKDSQIEALTADAADKDRKIESLAADIAGQIEALAADVTDKDSQIEALTANVADKNGQIEALTADVADKNGQIEALTADVADKNGKIEALTANIADKDSRIEALAAEAEDKGKQIDSLNAALEQALEAIPPRLEIPDTVPGACNTTREFLYLLEQGGVAYNYLGVNEYGTDCITVDLNCAGHGLTFRLLVYSGGEDVHLWVSDITSFASKLQPAFSAVCNELNSTYRFTTFFLEYDNTVSMDMDFIIRDNGSAGEIVLESLLTAYEILESAYPSLENCGI